MNELSCIYCGAEGLETIAAAGFIAPESRIGLGYHGITVGAQFYCASCSRISDTASAGMAPQEFIPLAQALVADARRRRNASAALQQQQNADQWKGLSW